MTRVAASPADVPAPFGPYSHSVSGGSFVAVAGQVGVSPQGQLAEGIEGQTRQALDNLIAALSAAGASAEDVVKVGLYLTDPAQMAEVNEIYEEYFDAPYPARTAVYVTLPAGLLVEVDAFAVKATP